MAISNEEAKQLLYDETPVYFKDIKHKKINGLIYRKSEEERIEIFGQEEAEVLLAKCQEEMATLINLVDQNKPDESQDSLHRLLSKLMKLDNELIKQVHAREKYGDDPKEGMEK